MQCIAAHHDIAMLPNRTTLCDLQYGSIILQRDTTCQVPFCNGSCYFSCKVLHESVVMEHARPLLYARLLRCTQLLCKMVCRKAHSRLHDTERCNSITRQQYFSEYSLQNMQPTWHVLKHLKLHELRSCIMPQCSKPKTAW